MANQTCNDCVHYDFDYCVKHSQTMDTDSDTCSDFKEREETNG